MVQAFLKKWWVESDIKAPNLPLSLRFKGSAVTITVFKYRSVTIVDGCESLFVVDFPGGCSLRPGTRLYSTSTAMVVFLHAVEIQVLVIRETCSTPSASETFVVGRTGTVFCRRWSIALKRKKNLIE